MTTIMLIVPRAPDLASDIKRSVGRLASSYASQLGPRYSRLANVRYGMSEQGAVLIDWPSSDSTFVTRIGKRWAASTSPEMGVPLIRSLKTNLGRISLSPPVWGTYMAISGMYDSDRIIAWNTIPALEAVHYGQDESFIYVSNRPLAIALALAESDYDRIDLAEDYLLDSLTFGFAMSEATPFKGVYTTPTRSAISIYRGELSLVSAPNPDPIEINPREDPLLAGADELAEALVESTRRAVLALPSPKVQLRLSGGKDSRLMLGLLLQHDLSPLIAVTQGGDDSEEVMVAAQLASIAGIQHNVTRPRLVDPSSVANSMLLSIRESQGQVLSEALGAPYHFADPFSTGEGYAAGQWPVFKDTYVRKSSPTLEDLHNEWTAHSSPILNDELLSLSRKSIERWAASVSGFSNVDMLYLYGKEVRASRYMQASNIAVDAHSQAVFPFMDSQVAAVSDGLTSRRRRSQIPMFLAIRKVWPEALSVPIARGGRFRFEASGPVEGISGGSYKARIEEPSFRPVNVLGNDYLDYADDRELIESPLTRGSRLVLEGENWGTLKQMVSADFKGRLRSLARLDSETDALRLLTTRRRRIHTRLYISRLILADFWLSKNWLGQ